MMDKKEITVEFIRTYCVANNQKEWYNATIQKSYPQKVYPRIEVDGKKVLDKSQEPKIEMKPITFVQLKAEFIEKFFPELAPKESKPKASLMFQPL